jgi:hypothetical protein
MNSYRDWEREHLAPTKPSLFIGLCLDLDLELRHFLSLLSIDVISRRLLDRRARTSRVAHKSSCRPFQSRDGSSDSPGFASIGGFPCEEIVNFSERDSTLITEKNIGSNL